MDVQAVPRTPLRPPVLRLPHRLLRLAGDDRLVEHVRAGSATAFEVAFDRHHRGVLALCRHMLGSVEEAEDAVQHTFMAAYRELRRSDRPMQLRPWLYAIARNHCLDVLRGRREQPLDTLEEPATEHLVSEVQRRQDLRDLLGDVAALPEDQRSALVLAELGGVSHDEIAQVLGCSRAKVKALVFQARTTLGASRDAREASCLEMREQLATLRGGSLRRTTLSRHLRECPGCREFRGQIRAQRRALAAVLPVAPTLGLKEAVLGSVVGTSTTSGLAAGTFAAKALVVAAVAGGGTAAGVDAVREPPLAAAEPARGGLSAGVSGEVRAAAPESLVPASAGGTSNLEPYGGVAGNGAAPPLAADGAAPPAVGKARGHADGAGAGAGSGSADGHPKGAGDGNANGHAKGGSGGDGNANGHANGGGAGDGNANGHAKDGGAGNAKGRVADPPGAGKAEGRAHGRSGGNGNRGGHAPGRGGGSGKPDGGAGGGGTGRENGVGRALGHGGGKAPVSTGSPGNGRGQGGRPVSTASPGDGRDRGGRPVAGDGGAVLVVGDVSEPAAGSGDGGSAGTWATADRDAPAGVVAPGQARGRVSETG